MRLFRRSQRAFEEEIRAHLDIETDQLIAEGHSPAEARELARKRFGNVAGAQERYYDASPFAWLHDAVTDARYSLRMIRKHPGFSTSVMLISALGLIACVTTFSLVSGILLKPFPFAEQDRVFEVMLRGKDIETWATPVDLFDSLSHAPELDAIATGHPRGVVVNESGELRRVSGYEVTPGYFKVYRLKPTVGRFFRESELDAVVLGYEEWRSRYGADTSVVGRSLIVNGTRRRIVGVMPPRFHDHMLRRRPLWMPWTEMVDQRYVDMSVNATVRIADGMDPVAAAASLRRYRASVEGNNRGDTVVASVSLLPVTEIVRVAVGRPLLILLGAVLLVLALVAANVATMFLAQVSSRSGELGVRRALGASRGRQLRQLIVESLTLTTLAGVAGLAVSALLIAFVRGEGLSVLPRMQEVSFDWRVASFGLGVILVTGLSGGLAQAFASRDRMWAVASTRVTGGRTSTALVMTQMALSVVLLVGAGLLVKSFMTVAPYRPGFATQKRAAFSVEFLDERQRRDTSSENLRAAIARAQEGMRGVSGVEDVAVSSYLPLSGIGILANVEAPGLAKQSTITEYFVSDNFFTVMEMSVRMGRSFTKDDRPGSERVAILNETAARKLFGRPDVLGARFSVTAQTQKLEPVTVIGVVNDTRTNGYDTKMRSQVYLPVAQYSMSGITFTAATSIEPSAVMPALRRALAASAPRAVIEDAVDVEAMVAHSVDRSKFFSVAMGLFAVTAALLTGLGIYGLLSYAVTQRRREIGIRLALGATTSRIGRSVVGRAAVIAAIGIPIGLAAAYGVSRFMGSILFEVKTTDLQVFMLVPAIALVFALAAALAPVYQAIRVDPNETMRV